jgi:hypothetical protein
MNVAATNGRVAASKMEKCLTQDKGSNGNAISGNGDFLSGLKDAGTPRDTAGSREDCASVKGSPVRQAAYCVDFTPLGRHC